MNRNKNILYLALVLMVILVAASEPGAVATGSKHSTYALQLVLPETVDCWLSVGSRRYRSRFCNERFEQRMRVFRADCDCTYI